MSVRQSKYNMRKGYWDYSECVKRAEDVKQKKIRQEIGVHLNPKVIDENKLLTKIREELRAVQ